MGDKGEDPDAHVDEGVGEEGAELAANLVAVGAGEARGVVKEGSWNGRG